MEVARLYLSPEEHAQYWEKTLYPQQYRRVLPPVQVPRGDIGFPFGGRFGYKIEYITVCTIRPIPIYDNQTQAWIIIEDNVFEEAEYNRVYYTEKG